MTKFRLILLCVLAFCATTILCVAMVTGTPLAEVWNCIAPHLGKLLMLAG